MRKIILLGFGMAALVVAAGLSGCTPDNNAPGLGSTPQANFTVTQLAGVNNTFVCTAGTSGVFGWYWSTGSGSPVAGTATDTIHFAQHGNYRIILTYECGPCGACNEYCCEGTQTIEACESPSTIVCKVGLCPSGG